MLAFDPFRFDALGEDLILKPTLKKVLIYTKFKVKPGHFFLRAGLTAWGKYFLTGEIYYHI